MNVGETRTGRALEVREVKAKINGRKTLVAFHAFVRPFTEQAYPDEHGGPPIVMRTTTIDVFDEKPALVVSLAEHGNSPKRARAAMDEQATRLAAADGLDYKAIA